MLTMELVEFRKLIDDFERNIIVGGIIDKRFTKKSLVSTKRGKLSKQEFGKTIGDVIKTKIVLAIDYYGHIKRSEGFLNKMNSMDVLPTEMRSYLVYFASIKMEDIVARTNDVGVMIQFPKLKNEILTLRGFVKRS